MLFSLVLYMNMIVVSAALFHVLVDHILETVAIAVLFYIIVTYELMNFWSWKLVNLSNQKSSSY